MARIKAPRGARSELYCMDRAFGHDWDAPRWKDGPDLRRGRSKIFIHHRVCRCVRCDSERVEVFEQGKTYLEKVANRYRYSQRYLARRRLTQGEIRLAMMNDELGREGKTP